MIASDVREEAGSQKRYFRMSRGHEKTVPICFQRAAEETLNL